MHYNIFPVMNKIFTKARNRSKRICLAMMNRIKACRLQKKIFYETKIYRTWYPGPIKEDTLTDNTVSYNIFGQKLDISSINWHMDYISGIEFEKKRFDRIKIKKYFNRADVKFPWETSRLYFLTDIARAFLIKKDNNYINLYKEIIINWQRENPYLTGINWFSGMEASIRAINIIVSYNILENYLSEDRLFCSNLSILLSKHLEYIIAFFENIENNHKIACYSGILFLSMSLQDYPLSAEYRKKALDGLVECINSQVLEDGADHEGSIAYHRLVLELFSCSALLCIANNIDLGEDFYKKLFKMYEFSAAYMDHSGNAPQVGDNDSGRVIIYDKSEEHDHSYLLEIGELIFDHRFPSQSYRKKNIMKLSVPEPERRIDIQKAGIIPRKTADTIFFKDLNAIILKDEFFSVFISCFPARYENSGHFHLDRGSFTLSFKGRQIIVDPGSYSYTGDICMRKRFRSRLYHNIPVTREEYEKDSLPDDLWDIRTPYYSEITGMDQSSTDLIIFNKETGYQIKRHIEIKNGKFILKDISDSEILSLLHFHPQLDINQRNNMPQAVLKGSILCNIRTDSDIGLTDYYYSHKYGTKLPAKCLVAKSPNSLEIVIEFEQAQLL